MNIRDEYFRSSRSVFFDQPSKERLLLATTQERSLLVCPALLDPFIADKRSPSDIRDVFII